MVSPGACLVCSVFQNRVLIDTCSLNTLPPRELTSGDKIGLHFTFLGLYGDVQQSMPCLCIVAHLDRDLQPHALNPTELASGDHSEGWQ
jgi:hypothetical protein